MTELALSTMWSKGKFNHMRSFVKDAHDFGFSCIELNSILTPERLEQLRDVEPIHISSVHCPCPAEVTRNGIDNTAVHISSLEEDSRNEAISYGKQTIKLASEVGAKAVILHAGRVEMDLTVYNRLRSLYNKGLSSSQEYFATTKELVKERDKCVSAHLAAVRMSLMELLNFAYANGIIIGLENRVHFFEIPSLYEMISLLEEFGAHPIGYWHDVGHAEVQSRLGFASQDEWFSNLGDRIIGVHLHDVQGIHDHFAPGLGTIDWDLISKKLPHNIIKVCEIGEWNNRKNALQTVPFLKKKDIV
ncbi:MAG: sugar phosphate isomerase/epimerase [Chloroflexota bacterium]|nr:sugar phosphate isomerase/epimerase [Chloroflexota bacterium]